MSDLKTLKNGLGMLRLLGTRPDAGIKDMAEDLGMSTSAVHRIASTLLAEGLLMQRPGSRKYSLSEGVTLWKASSSLERVLACAPDYLRTLRDSTRETVHLAVRTGLKVTFPLGLESALELRVSSKVGTTAPLNASATGKVLLSSLSDAAIRQLLGGHALEAPTEYSIASIDALIKEMGQVRAHGYATNVSETETGVYTLAVPVRGDDGEVVCALSVSAPLSRVRVDPAQHYGLTPSHLLDALRLCGSQISEALKP